MAMKSKKIEDIAIHAVKDFFLPCDTIEMFIASNDKEPTWDGHFYLYNDGDGRKEHLIGRVAAQIKGKTIKQFKEKGFNLHISYPRQKASNR